MTVPAYPLAGILELQRRNEEAAAVAVAVATEECRLARERLQTNLRHVEEYRQWRLGEEERLFAEIRGQVVSPCGVNLFRSSGDYMRGEEDTLHAAVEESRRQVEAAENAVEERKREHFEMLTELRQIQEHRDIWLAEEKVKLEAKEESMLEDSYRALPREE